MTKNRKCVENILLCKFATVCAAKKILANQTLRFTPLRSYNDPFEGENAYIFTCDSFMQVCVVDENGNTRTLAHSPDMEVP